MASNNRCTKCDKYNCQNLCGKCRIVNYCSKECQINDWKEHKNNCIEAKKNVENIVEIARTLKRNKEYLKALEKVEEALRILPENSDALYIKAMIYEESGYLENALKILEDLTREHKNNPTYDYSYSRCLYFLGEYEKAWNKLNEKSISIGTRLEKTAEYLIRLLIITIGYIHNPNQDFIKWLDRFNLWTFNLRSKLIQDERIIGDFIYADTISLLIRNGIPLPKTIPSKQNSIILLGESHILPLCWQTISLDKEYILFPRLIMGLTAWHFSDNSKPSKELSMLNKNLDRIDPGSICLLVVGELDCRNNQGIHKATLKYKYSNEDEALTYTIDKFIEGLLMISNNKNITFIIHPVRPTPKPSSSRLRKATLLDIQNEKQRIVKFNLYLNKKISEFSKSHNSTNKIIFLDFFQDLCDNDGWLKSQFQNEDIHMNHTYLPILNDTWKHYNNC